MRLAVYTKNVVLFYLFVSIFSSFALISASEFEADEHIRISNIHVIEGDLYTWGKIVSIDGTINGDLNNGSDIISINGIIENSANIFAKKFSHNGEIKGSLRVFANDAIIEGIVKRSGLFFCNEIKIGKNAVIGNDVNLYGSNINFEGTVHGNATIYSGSSISIDNDFSFSKENIYISGTIDGDLTIHGKNIHIISPALIKGNFKYVSENQANIEINSGVTILGNTTWDLPENIESKSDDNLLLAFIKTSSKFIAAFLFGLLLMVLCKKYISSMVFQLNERFAISAAVGFISLAILVVFIIILFITLILTALGYTLISENNAIGGTIALALSTIMIPISSIVITTLGILIYSGKIILALLLGYTVVGKLKSNASYLSKTQLFIGLILLYILFAIPYLGTLLFFIVSIIGMGAIILGIKDCHKGLHTNKIKDQAGI